MDDLVKRLRQTPIYEGNGEESDLPEQAAERIEALERQVKAADALAEACEIMAEGTLSGVSGSASMRAALAAYRATEEGGA